VSTDADHRFELAISLNDLETALALVRASPEAGSQAKWKLVGDKALAAWQMDLAQEAFEKANDLAALLLLYTSLSDRAGMERLAKLACECSFRPASWTVSHANETSIERSEQHCLCRLSPIGRYDILHLAALIYRPSTRSRHVCAYLCTCRHPWYRQSLAV
jgi:hypothetical protein